MPPKYCIFRTDAIGDLILTLPMAFAIKASRPGAEVTFCVQEYTRPIASLCPAVDDVLTTGARDLEGNLFAFADTLRERAFTTAVFAYPRPMLALAARIAGIPTRIGTAYRFYSFLFSEKQREHRRESALHESRYNLNLLVHAGIKGYTAVPPLLRIPGDLAVRADLALNESGIGGDPFVILHPGSAGSADTWSVESFAALGEMIANELPGIRILITGGAKEQQLVESLVAAIGRRAAALRRQLPLDEFAAVIASADALVANSTGPLHIAAAIGVPVVGLYPDTPVMHPRRWGPLGDDHIVLTPPGVGTHSDSTEVGMDSILVERVFHAVRTLLRGT